MSQQSVQADSTARLPQAHPLILAATGKDLSIRAESHRPRPIHVPLQRLETASIFGLPQADRLIFAAARQGVATWMESHRPHPIGVPL